MPRTRNAAYLILKIEHVDAVSSIVKLESVGENGTTFDDFCDALPPEEPRYGFCLVAGKMIFVFWQPENARVIEVLTRKTGAELTQAEAEAKWDEWIAKYDSNKDGKFSYEEFAAAHGAISA